MYSGLGGHGNVVFTLLSSLVGDQFDNKIVFYGIEPVVPEYLHKLKVLNINYIAITKKSKQYLKPIRRFFCFLKTEKPDRIIVHSSELIIPAVRYCRKNKECKALYIEHEPNQTKNFLQRVLTGHALKHADVVVCLNEVYKKELSARYHVSVPIEVIPNGIDVDRFAPNPTKPRSKIQVLGMAGRMVDTKDHAMLIRAFAQLGASRASLRLRLAGTGELETRLRVLAQSLGLTSVVDFCGLLNEEQLLDFYHSLDLYVHATRSETLSTSILQAMACGLPVLTSDIDNNAALITHGVDGWLYSVASESDMTDQCRILIGDPMLASSLAANARRTVESHYSSRSMSSQYIELLTSPNDH